jgi:hypothetical protein
MLSFIKRLVIGNDSQSLFGHEYVKLFEKEIFYICIFN